VIRVYIVILSVLIALSGCILYFVNKEATTLYNERTQIHDDLEQKIKAVSGMVNVVSERAMTLLKMLNESDAFKRDDQASYLRTRATDFVIFSQHLKSSHLTEDENKAFRKALAITANFAPVEPRVVDLMAPFRAYGIALLSSKAACLLR